MNRGGNIVKALPNDVTLFYACFVGAGAADATLATDAQYPKVANMGLTMARTSIGLFVVTLLDCTPRILEAVPTVLGTEGLRATVKVATDTKLKTLTLNIWDPAGSLDDPETTDTVRICFHGMNSTA